MRRGLGLLDEGLEQLRLRNGRGQRLFGVGDRQFRRTKGQEGPTVHERLDLARTARCDTREVESRALEGANPARHQQLPAKLPREIGLSFDQQGVDSPGGEEVAEQGSSRPGSDDGDSSVHSRSSPTTHFCSFPLWTAVIDSDCARLPVVK